MIDSGKLASAAKRREFAGAIPHRYLEHSMFEKSRAVAQKYGSRPMQFLKDAPLRVAVIASVALAPVLSHAQTADPFDAASASVKTAVGKYGAELVAIAAVGVIFMVGIKYVKKIRGAA